MDTNIMKQRIKYVMDPTYDFLSEMQRSRIIYYLKKYHSKSHKQSPTSFIDIKIMVNDLPIEQLKHVYKLFGSCIDHALKHEVCPTCKRPMLN